MRILLLSFYYPPDIGPGSLRAKSIVDALRVVSQLSDVTNLSVDVLTTLPHRYRSLTANALEFEQEGNVTVRRLSLPKHRSGMADQSWAFIFYALAIQRHVNGEVYDVVIATSGRLLTASLAAWVAHKSGAKLYLDIRDLFTDTLRDCLAKIPARMVLPGLLWLENWTFRKADRINLVSEGFLPHLQAIVPEIKLSVLTNGIDNEFLISDFSSECVNETPMVLYAGNMGEGQGLHHIIPVVAKSFEGKVNFELIGDGGRKAALINALTLSGASNVGVLDPVPRENLIPKYREADVLFLHLNDYPVFRKVLPSKIFEYAATNKPILAGVGGYAADFLREQIEGVEVFSPGDSVAMEQGLKRLLSGPRIINRSAFCQRYRRDGIMRQLARDVLALEFGRQ